MGTEASSDSTNVQHRIWLDRLHHLFRCPRCNASLVDALVHAHDCPAGLHTVPCVDCGSDWAFVRLPQSLYENPQIDAAQADAALHALDADVSSDVRDRRRRFWQATLRMFP